MPITIRIPPPLRKFTAGAQTFESTARNLVELFEALEKQFPGIKQNLCQADGSPQRFLNIYVNDEDIRFLGGAGYTFQDGDEVLLVPAIAGGSPDVVATRWPLERQKLQCHDSRRRVTSSRVFSA